MSQDHGERQGHGERIATLESRVEGLEASSLRVEQKQDRILELLNKWTGTVGGAVMILGVAGWVGSLFKDWIWSHLK